MTVTAAVYWLLAAAAGLLIAGAVRVPLRIEERVGIAVVTGVLGSALAALGVALAAGLRTQTILAGPLLLCGVTAAVLARTGGITSAWEQSLGEVGERWRSRELLWVGLLALAAVIGFSVLFAHTLFVEDGAIKSNFATVWADWSNHATTASSFALGQDLPPDNPIFSGTSLLYPFLPDFLGGMLVTLGVSVQAALAIPGAVMCVAITLLLVSLARRLSGSLAVGVLAMAICMLGGSLGIEAMYWDACTHQESASQCAPGRFVHDPIGATGTAIRTVVEVPATIGRQTRPYDGLQASREEQPVGGISWYTPMLAWWLPQRPFLFGFAGVLTVLLLLVAARREEGRRWSAFAVAGLVAGVLPLVHVHSFIALVLVLPVFALMWRRREWLVLGAIMVAMAAPRLVQLSKGDHGTTALGNAFPWLEPGWLSGTVQDAGLQHRLISFGNVLWGIGQGLHSLIRPQWWGFWVLNCGIVLPVFVILAIAAAGRWAPRDHPVRRWGDRISGLLPRDLLLFALPFLVIFAAANVVVFQSWDWDNTKLFSYWYFAGALLVAALVRRAWRGGMLPWVLGTLAFVSVIMTGAVVMLRFMPWTPANASNAGPFVWASAEERQYAARVAEITPHDAVVLTQGRPTDPMLTLAGRRAVEGYDGWLWSYGIDYDRRHDDVATMYQAAGCVPGSIDCGTVSLLRRYHVSYVQIEMDVYRQRYPDGNLNWWSSTFPEVARAGDIVLYDVQRAR